MENEKLQANKDRFRYVGEENTNGNPSYRSVFGSAHLSKDETWQDYLSKTTLNKGGSLNYPKANGRT